MTNNRKSATKLSYSLTPPYVGLPSDLQAALNLSQQYAGNAGAILSVASDYAWLSKNESTGKRAIETVISSLNAIRYEYPFNHRYRDVSLELIAASEPNSRFEEDCAHFAAITRSMELLWYFGTLSGVMVPWVVGSDPNRPIPIPHNAIRPPGMRNACEGILKMLWPDWGRVMKACTIEASRSAFARQQSLVAEVSKESKALPALMGVQQIADALGVNLKAAEGRFWRLRQKRPDCYVENTEKGVRQSFYLLRSSDKTL